MRLENNLMYQPMCEQKALPAPRERQEVYTVGNLESMSASLLYSKEKEKKENYTKGNEKNLNFYNRLNLDNFGETDFYLQKEGETHKKFKKRMKEGKASGGTISPGGNFSTGNSY